MVKLVDSFPPLPSPQKGEEMLVWIKVATATVVLGIVLISLFHALRRCRSNNNDAPPRIELHAAIPGVNSGNTI
uniref:Uncharacterized protein n=1 Tax=Fagus sylvatica TaxID=28930 RepID=A0A2N9F418_FAGSY